MAKRQWHEDPAIAEDTVHWKPKSERWFWAAALSVAAALLVNGTIPAVRQIQPLAYRCMLALGIAALLLLYLIALGKPRFRAQLYHKAQFIFACGITLTALDLLTGKSGLLPLPYFPGAAEIISVMFDDRRLLLRSALYSLRLFSAGLITGASLGLVTGTCIGWWRQWDYWLAPVIRVTGIIPAVAWLPIALLILPNSFTTGVFLIFIASWFPVSSMMAAGSAPGHCAASAGVCDLERIGLATDQRICGKLCRKPHSIQSSICPLSDRFVSRQKGIYISINDIKRSL